MPPVLVRVRGFHRADYRAYLIERKTSANVPYFVTVRSPELHVCICVLLCLITITLSDHIIFRLPAVGCDVLPVERVCAVC